MKKIIMVASSKGGIGKTTIAIGIAKALVRKGKKVLLVDLDFSNPCLDVLLDTHSLYTLTDAIEDKCLPIDIVKKSESDIYVIGSSPISQIVSCDNDMVEKYCDIIKGAATVIEADYVILDTGAGISDGFTISTKIADEAIVVATHSPVSTRSADNTSMRIRENGIENVSLIINSYDTDGTIKNNLHSKIVDIIEETHTKLLGVVTYDYGLVLEAEKSKKVKLSKQSICAFDNIASRIMGASVPLFSGMGYLRRKRYKIY